MFSPGGPHHHQLYIDLDLTVQSREDKALRQQEDIRLDLAISGTINCSYDLQNSFMKISSSLLAVPGNDEGDDIPILRL